jgi:hypothetical protein
MYDGNYEYPLNKEGSIRSPRLETSTHNQTVITKDPSSVNNVDHF